jgi:diacylglycerol kinase (ATP)
MSAAVGAPSSVRPIVVIAGFGSAADGASTRSDLERALERRALGFRFCAADTTADAAQLATEALDRGERFLVAVGDDELVQGVVNGMFRDGATIAPEPIVGVVPAGAANDLVRSFNLPRELDRAVGHLEGDETYPLDVMKVTSRGPDGADRTRYAHNLAQIGLGAEVSLRTSRMPRFLGDPGRTFAGFWSGYARSRQAQMRIAIDTK